MASARKKQSLTIEYNYDVIFTTDVFSPKNKSLNEFVTKKDQTLCFIDEHLLKHHKTLKQKIKTKLACKIIPVPSGEKIKNNDTIVDLVGKHVRKEKLCRHSSCIIVGGGAVLDAVGFALSIIHRGMRHIRIPTTVLSQNDSGVGVKNGINGWGTKNFYGCFLPPQAVINDDLFLASLHQRDWVSGIAEAFKVAIIKDKSFLSELIKSAEKLKQRDHKSMINLIKRCAIIHLDHIKQGGDPFEFGSSRPLDFGHWSAHKLEGLTKNKLRHGEAVAIGIALDCFIASQRKYISPSQCKAICLGMSNCGLALWHDKLTDPALLQGVSEFREHIGGELCLTMPKGLGKSCEINSLTKTEIKKAIKDLQKFTKQEGIK